MKKILVLLVLLLSAPFCLAKVLEATVTYDEDSARAELFKDAKMEIDIKPFKSKMRDPFYAINKDYMKYGLSPDGRSIHVFKKGMWKICYVVQYDDMPGYNFYFIKLTGSLVFIDIASAPKKDKYPYKSYRYDTNGKLVAAGLFVSESKGYLFDNNKKLLSYGVNNDGFDDKGNKIWTLEPVEY